MAALQSFTVGGLGGCSPKKVWGTFWCILRLTEKCTELLKRRVIIIILIACWAYGKWPGPMLSASCLKCRYTFCLIVCLLWSIMQCGQQKMASRKYSKAWQGRNTACVFSYGDKIMVTVGKSSTHTESLRIKMLLIATSVLYQECVNGACMCCIYVQLKLS